VFSTDSQRPPRVLVVDDSKLNRELLEAYLVQFGADVTLAHDGREGLERALQSPPDVVLTDLQMPRMDGLELCRQLKADPATQFVPIVMLTAMEGEEEKMRAIEAGADDFMTKPYSAIMLMTRVRNLLKSKQLSDQIQERNRLMRKMLNRYVSQEVADMILMNPERALSLGGDTRVITVLFADIRGFTHFTENHPAEQVVETLNSVFAVLTPVVFKHRGTFDKYLGDAIMAFYGAPVAGPDDHLRAARTALEMQAMFSQLQATHPELGQLGLGIALNSGDAIVGNVGSEKVMDYTVIGDTVNVTARLQGEARSGEVLISAATYELLKEQVAAEPLGLYYVKGRSEPVQAYALRNVIGD
jgi:adenylate cyclase